MFDLHGRLVSLLERYIDRNIRAPIVIAVDPHDGDRAFAQHLWHKHAEVRETSHGYFVEIGDDLEVINEADRDTRLAEAVIDDAPDDHTLAASLAEPHLDQCECGSWFVTQTLTRTDSETVESLWTCHVCDRELGRVDLHLPGPDQPIKSV
jgi:hypothetical protein